ncbi:MAG: DUF4058 family protein [Anaerolineaceae bacterium]|nr:DUF4058 family protein [Anaerolineaceae bacterium]
MPSPFPGMDPYLEVSRRWSDLHQRLITYISEYLQPQLRPKYIARIEERIQLATFDQRYVPDVQLLHTMREPAPTLELTSSVVVDEPMLITTLDEAVREPFIEIVARESGDLVTVIEVLSPANKVGKGREEYLQKQDDLTATEVNLVEIDLLGYGNETVLARKVGIVNPADWRYLIDISRGGRRNVLEVYAIPLRDRLPNCRIPLRPPDGDAVLDLTAVFNRCYDVGSYDLLIDYRKMPDVPLQEAEADWLQKHLQEKGLIPTQQEQQQ